MYVNDYFPEEKKLNHSTNETYYSNLRKCYRYHYTSLKSVLGILESKCLWLTHYSTQNDTSEGRLILDQLKDKIDNYNEIFNMLTKNLYLCSFSLFGNMLSQWRAYGNINIGFDYEAMENDLKFIEDKTSKKHDTSGIVFPYCDYTNTDDVSFEAAVDEVKKRIDKIDHNSIPSQQYNYLSIGSSCFSYKHSGFKEEKEYRIYHHFWDRKPFEDNGKRYLKFPFAPDKIKRIAIGPSEDQDYYLNKIGRFIGMHEEYKHVEIERSMIPYINKD